MAKVKSKSVAQEIKEKGKARLKVINDLLRPLLSEREELVQLLGEAPKPKVVSSPAPASARPTRNRKGGRREDQFVAVVKKNPGINVTDAAKALKVKPNYLYRIAKAAEQRGKVVKDGSAYKVKA